LRSKRVGAEQVGMTEWSMTISAGESGLIFGVAAEG
jgi:hypothetical protein